MRRVVRKNLSQLFEAYIKKLRCFTQVVILRMLYQLRIAGTPLCMLHQLIHRLQMVVKSILNLPEWNLTNWIHAGTGMRVLDLSKLVLFVCLKAAECMCSETNSACRALSEEHLSVTGKHLDFLGLRKDGRSITEKDIHQKRTPSVKSKLNGGALFTMRQSIT